MFSEIYHHYLLSVFCNLIYYLLYVICYPQSVSLFICSQRKLTHENVPSFDQSDAKVLSTNTQTDTQLRRIYRVTLQLRKTRQTTGARYYYSLTTFIWKMALWVQQSERCLNIMSRNIYETNWNRWTDRQTVRTPYTVCRLTFWLKIQSNS